MNKKLLIFGGLGAGIILVLVILYSLLSEDPIEKKFREVSENSSLSVRQYNELEGIKWVRDQEGHLIIDGELSFDQIVALLRKKYGEHIDHPSIQVRMLEELMRYLQGKYPNDWISYLKEILSAAFPELASKLFQMSENLYKYSKFLKDHQFRASLMSAEDRDKYIWDERHKIFGEDADKIWSSEIANRSVNDTLKQIESMKGASMKERLDVFKDSLQKTYGETLPSVMDNRRQNFLDGFVTAVQEDLRGMSPSQRREALHEIREGMGLDDAAISRWDALDTERDQRWSNGQVYESQRKEIGSRYSGSEKEQKLDEIRRKLFGEEAETIKNEENSGYFRYQNAKQQYGIN